MIDLHSHILPGVDDGSRTVEQSLSMLRIAAADGVTVQVLTPHVSVMYPNRPDDLKVRFDRFVEAAGDVGVALRLSAEVAITPAIPAMIEERRMPWIGAWNGRPAFLLEFPAAVIPPGSLLLARRLIASGVTPLVVHPERNRQFQADPALLGEYVQAGCLAQITAGSIAGEFGRPPFEASVKMLEGGWVHFLATDCHDDLYRPPGLRKGLRQAAEILGDEAARALVGENPARLLGLSPTQGAHP